MGNSVSQCFIGDNTIDNIKLPLPTDKKIIRGQISIPNTTIADTEVSNDVGKSDDIDSVLEYEYKMDHKKRGKMIVFNHLDYDDSNLRKRNGTHEDCEKLRTTFARLDFDVEIYNDLTLLGINETLRNTADEDHSDEDCLVIFVLTHGEIGTDKRNTILTHDQASYIYARDEMYPLQNIFNYFTDENCPSLANKPRLFFIQACQGKKTDAGIRLRFFTETDSIRDEIKPIKERILPLKDFLVVYASMPGFYSFRNTTHGSWFIKELCKEMDDNVEKRKNYDLMKLLTFVVQSVAYNHESSSADKAIDQKKQIPCVVSMLTKLLYLSEK